MELLRTLRYSVLVLAAVVAVAWTAGRALGMGEILGETKEELKLKYDVSVYDHGTGRVTVVFTLADDGRLKPLDGVQLVIPAREKNKDGSYWMDLVVSIDMTKTEGGKREGRVHIHKDLAKRAQIYLNTHTMDGKEDPLTRLHYVIPIAKYLNKASKKAAEPAAAAPAKPGPPAAPAAPAAKAPPKAAHAGAAGTAGLHVTVYETKLPADRVAAVDIEALVAEGDTTARLQAALTKLGQTRILYHAYQLTALAGESRIHIGSRRPFVTQSRAAPSSPRTIMRPQSTSSSPGGSGGSRPPGPVQATGSPRTSGTPWSAGMSRIITIQYENVGMIFNLFIEPTRGEPKSTLATKMELELSTLADSGVEIAEGVQAPEVRRVRIDRTAGMVVGRPIVAVQMDGSASGKDAPATAYVCRVLLSKVP